MSNFNLFREAFKAASKYEELETKLEAASAKLEELQKKLEAAEDDVVVASEAVIFDQAAFDAAEAKLNALTKSLVVKNDQKQRLVKEMKEIEEEMNNRISPSTSSTAAICDISSKYPTVRKYS